MFTYIILQEIYCRYYLYWWKCSHKHCPFDTSNPLTNPRFIICKLTHLGSTIPYTSLDKSKSSPCNWGHRDWYTCDSVYPLWDSIWVLYMFLYTTVKYGVLQKYSSSTRTAKYSLSDLCFNTTSSGTWLPRHPLFVNAFFANSTLGFTPK